MQAAIRRVRRRSHRDAILRRRLEALHVTVWDIERVATSSVRDVLRLKTGRGCVGVGSVGGVLCAVLVRLQQISLDKWRRMAQV